ncbi:hypothetical protein [Neobacillus sp. LXY-1]|uniref:hypothetical protein n=1 Tax=Neobacillus sp. LXY-1 TaxID=3379133 RepID=UPI003EE27852
MKVYYPLKSNVELKEIKEALKPYGGRCAKIVDDTLEYQIKEEYQSVAYEFLKDKGYIN